MHQQLSEDLRRGLYENVNVLEFSIAPVDHRTFGGVYAVMLVGEGIDETYLYGDTDEFFEDMEEVTNIYGIKFKRLQHHHS